MRMSYCLNELFINGIVVEVFPLPAKIWKVIFPSENIAVVQMAMSDVDDSKYDTCRNVFGVSSEGKVLWQIERCPHSRFYSEGNPIPNPYLNVYLRNDKLYGNTDLCAIEIDENTGKIKNIEFEK